MRINPVISTEKPEVSASGFSFAMLSMTISLSLVSYYNTSDISSITFIACFIHCYIMRILHPLKYVNSKQWL